jgi:HSP20 family molecular chaperone IbpA
MDTNVYNPRFINHIANTLNEVTDIKNSTPNHCVRYLDGKYYIELELPGIDPDSIVVLVKPKECRDEINLDVKKFYMNNMIDLRDDTLTPVNVKYKTGMFNYIINLPQCNNIKSYYMWGILTFEVIPIEKSTFNINITNV